MSFCVETTVSDIVFKVIFLGDTCTGKTAILNKYINHHFPISFSSTIGVDFFIKTLDYNDINYKLHIWDTAGQEKFASIVRTYYKGAAIAVMVYDVTDRKTFQNIENWIDLFYSNSNTDKPILIVGNKTDLEYKRQVSYKEGVELSERYEANFIEVSAKDGTNIDKIFDNSVETINNILSGNKYKKIYNNDLDGISIFNKKILRNITSLRIKDSLPHKGDVKNKCCSIL